MSKLLLVLFVLIPLIDALLLFQLAGIIGGWNVTFLVLASGLLGAWLFKLEGRRTLQSWQEALAQGRAPEEGVLGGLLMVMGSLYLVTPGVGTDVLGLLLLFPPLRRLVARLIRPRLVAWAESKSMQRPAARVVYSDGIERTGDVALIGRRVAVDAEPPPPQIIDAQFEVKPSSKP